MEFLYLLRPVRIAMLTEGPTEVEGEVVARHFEYISALASRGVLEMAGRTLDNDESTFGIALFRARSEAEAMATMEADPAISEGVMTGRLYPFRVAVRGEPAT